MIENKYINKSGLSESPDFDFQASIDRLYFLYEQLVWGMEDTVDFCRVYYGVRVDRGGGYQDLVNGLMNTVIMVMEEISNMNTLHNGRRSFILEKPHYIEQAIDCVYALEKYHQLLRDRRFFAENEALISMDSHRPRKGNKFEPIMLRVLGDRKKFIELVTNMSDSKVISMYTKALANEQLEGDEGQKGLLAVNE